MSGFRSAEQAQKDADTLMDYVAANPDAVGNHGRLAAAKAILELGALNTLPVPERWYELREKVARIEAGV